MRLPKKTKKLKQFYLSDQLKTCRNYL